MKRVWRQVLAVAALLTGGGAVVSACAHDDSTIFVYNVFAGQFTESGMVCTYQSNPTSSFFESSGLLDLALRPEYDAMFLVGNQMVPEVNQSQLQTETSNVNIEGAIVRITDSYGNAITSYTRLAAGTILASGGNVPGYSPIGPVTLLDPGTLFTTQVVQTGSGSQTVSTYLNSYPQGSAVVRLVTFTRFFGHSLGGEYVESGEFEFPIDVCNGCLISYTDNPAYETPNCVAGGTTSTAAAQVPCILGEDLPVDCSLCLGVPMCQGVGTVLATPGDAGAG